MKRVFTYLFATMVLMALAVPSQAQQVYRNIGNGPLISPVHNTIQYQNDQRNPQVTFLEEGFESGSFDTNGWALTDSDGDGNNWYLPAGFTAHTGTATASSHSWLGGSVLNPDNWLASPPIDLTSAAGTVLLDFWVRAQDQVWPSEHYAVYASTTGDSPADFTGGDGANLFEETVVAGTDAANNLYVKRTVDLSAYAGELVYIAFRHFNCSDWFALNIDDILVYESSTVDVGITGVVAPSNEVNCLLTDDEPVTVTLFNFGGAPQTGFDISYTLNGTTVTETMDGVVEPASSFDYTFAQNASFTDLGYFTMDFAISVDGDVDESNNSFTAPISSTDANVEVVVSSDSQGGQGWELISTDGTVIASHGAYQWNITESTKVCVIADDCYRFNWYGGGTNTVSVYYNGDLVNTTEASGDYTLFAVGGACAPVNVLFAGHYIQDYGVVGSQEFGGAFLNIGSDDITSFDVQYSIDGMASAVETVSGISVPQGQLFNFVHPTPYDFTAIGEYNVELSISNFNGSVTPDPNMLSHTINILSYAPTTRILGEEATGTWCGWCTRGHVFMEIMEQTYPDTWIGVAVHNADPMVVGNYDGPIGDFIGGYPSGLVNRHDFGNGLDVDPSQFGDAYDILINRVVPADIEISATTFDEATRKLTFNVNAIFAGNVNKDFNINAIIIENHVTGTGADWNQANYYSGGGSGPMGGYEDLPDPVLAADMVYENVARAILGGWFGIPDIIRGTTAEGTYSYKFTYTVPADENIDNMHIIGVVSDTNTGEIINSNKVSVNTAVGVEEISSLVDFNVYPNPTSDVLNLELNLEEALDLEIYMTDFMGRVVMDIDHGQIQNGYQKTLNLKAQKPGVYFINVKSTSGLSVKKVVKL